MTLRELINFLNLYVSFPESVEDLEIKNEAEFCRYPMIRYFLSENFQMDMEKAEEDLKTIPNQNAYFIFRRNKSGEFSIKLIPKID